MSPSSSISRFWAYLPKRSLSLSYHLLAWAVYVLLLWGLNGSPDYWWFTLESVLIHAAFMASLVYLNRHYLLPRYFKPGRFLNYFSHLLFFSLALTPLEMICLYWQMQEQPSAQIQLIQNQVSHWLVLFLGGSSSTVFVIVKEWIQSQRIRKDLEYKSLQAELSFLRSQIQPHFLFNTLNSIYALSLKKSDTAPEMILRLSEMLRYMLYDCGETKVALSSELRYLRNYLALEALRHGQAVAISLDTDLDREDYTIAPLLLIPFLENAFKHGLHHRLEDAFVEAELYVEQGQLEFIVRNAAAPSSTKGLPKVGKVNQGGIGLKNVRRRLELLYPQAHELDIKPGPEHYVVYLQINLL